MAKLDLDRMVEFEKLLHAFARVERVMYSSGKEDRENDAEHSFFMAMLAWYAIEAFRLPLDSGKVLRYALAHDLVEVYAGDTYTFDAEGAKTKHEREKAAQERIKNEFPEFAALQRIIEDYEAQTDEESRFVKALDKIEPVLSNYVQSGRPWKIMGVGFGQLVSHKREKLANHAAMRELFEEIIARIEPRKSDYFPK